MRATVVPHVHMPWDVACMRPTACPRMEAERVVFRCDQADAHGLSNDPRRSGFPQLRLPMWPLLWWRRPRCLDWGRLKRLPSILPSPGRRRRPVPHICRFMALDPRTVLHLHAATLTLAKALAPFGVHLFLSPTPAAPPDHLREQVARCGADLGAVTVCAEERHDAVQCDVVVLDLRGVSQSLGSLATDIQKGMDRCALRDRGRGVLSVWPTGWECIRREGASEAAPAAVREAVGGGCQSGWGGYCPLQMPLKPALGIRKTVAGHRLGALEGGGYLPLPLHPCLWDGGWGGYGAKNNLFM